MEKLPQSKINFAKNTQAPKTQNKPAVKNQIQTNKTQAQTLHKKLTLLKPLLKIVKMNL